MAILQQKILMICHSKIRLSFILISFLCCGLTTYAQSYITGISSYYDDSASEWTIYGVDANEEEEIEGELRIKWILRNDFSEWTLDYDNLLYTVRQKFNNDNSQWSIRSEQGEVADIKTKWHRDYSEWVVSYNREKYTWQTVYKNDGSQWYYETDKDNYIEMFTANGSDTRDWIVNDYIELDDIVKLSFLFITMYNTTPKQ